MVFSSLTFLFAFLPPVVVCFFALPPRARTPFLVVVSWLFYAWGEKEIVLFLVATTVVNWALALWLERAQSDRRKLILAVAAVANIGALLFFKYTNFFIQNVNEILSVAGVAPLQVPLVHLPIGVSFVTFEALSYVIDVYRRDLSAARNPLHVAFYISFFPHLIAGPILRYRDIAGPLAGPAVTLSEFDRGVSRFISGLAKKVLLANTLGHVADQIFALGPAQLGTSVAWLGSVAYAFQIYFDFSGYSDMAIGLGHMFGFTLPENFRQPYTAQSIQEFWRRWHISLSSWFRDYLFRPLGGSRLGAARTYCNLLIVFLLCGLWHGAKWNFVAWGLFHGAFLVMERTPLGRLFTRAPRPARHAYTILVVLIGWVFFRADTLGQALRYLRAMAGLGYPASVRAVDFVTLELVITMSVAAMLATVPWNERLKLARLGVVRPLAELSTVAVQLALLALSILYLAAGTYNPFIYFRF